MEPTILITGGAGYIGSHTAFYLSQKGYKIIILDNFSQNQDFNISWAKVIKSDFSDEKTLERIFSQNKIDAVMHFAAFINVSESVKSPAKYYINNISKTINLLDKMIEHNIKKFIFSSSCAVYGNPCFLPLTENHPLNPITPYGKSKLIIENILKDMNNAYGMQFVCLRYFNAAGALPEYNLGEQHLEEGHLIPSLIRSSYMNKPFSVYGNDYPTKDGTCIRDFIHVLDIAEAHWLALKHLTENKPSDFFNLGTGNGFSIKEIIQSIENISRSKINIIYSKKRQGDPPTLIADASKASTILNWNPKFSDLEFIIRSALAFEYKNKKINN